MKLRLKDLRTQRKWTLDQVSEMTNLAKGYLSELERGLKLPSAESLGTLAGAFGVSVAEMIEDASSIGLLEHMRIMRDLPPEDQEAVVRHAQALLRKHGG